MVKQNDNSGNVIIGEAALSLAIEEKDINITSIFNQLSLMASNTTSGPRLARINEARNLLLSFDTRELSVLQQPLLRKLSDLNDEIS